MKYAPSVGVKFHEDGSVRHFPGNTFICHVNPTLDLINELAWAQDQLKAMACGHKFAYLPISSMHMTVFEGVCDQVRLAEKWTSKLPLDAPIDQTTDFFASAIGSLGPHAGFEMVFDYVYNCPIGGTAIRIKPANEASAQALANSRNQLRDATGIEMPDFDSYHFHITLSYRVIELEEHEKEEVKATADAIAERLSTTFGLLKHGPVEFCTFDNMFKFTPLIKLS
ncbi:DUF1868 domain-containing protein [Photobacterium sanctipauli]|uniref:DUF1868 domain-containing protein n=1 Tax=Photobacterium sanctipauli TaxID=1342794 RepID=A0A2T3NBN3_9GAMM|nr:DUF1868 domain-containing protein [Photobacterium sanctipauli]PSW11382.1 DUF1868 domain-containing protein [Photobacterium sanctipauli]